MTHTITYKNYQIAITISTDNVYYNFTVYKNDNNIYTEAGYKKRATAIQDAKELIDFYIDNNIEHSQ